jgi:DNA (cytosine-5)-methyltransferase 1
MLSIGTDCSGIEAPLEALKQLKIPFIQKWTCEIDKYARMSYEANYPKPEKKYIDMLKRNNSELPSVDLYVCGFPCQAFSNMGNRLGTKDPRAKIIPKMIDTIKHSKPKICILENVRGFLNIENGVPKENLLKDLENLNYRVYYSLYNTKNYGLPQNRERVYFVCIRRDVQKKEYIKPKECKMKPFESILTDTKINPGEMPESYYKNLYKLKNETKILKRDNYYSPMEYISPTLDTKCNFFFIIKQNRTLNPVEALRLQGFKSFKQVISDTQFMKQIGNSMSVNVLKYIIKEALKCVN